jgi:hypothetical protein
MVGVVDCLIRHLKGDHSLMAPRGLEVFDR